MGIQLDLVRVMSMRQHALHSRRDHYRPQRKTILAVQNRVRSLFHDVCDFSLTSTGMGSRVPGTCVTSVEGCR
jgi:hypothetical protein